MRRLLQEAEKATEEQLQDKTQKIVEVPDKGAVSFEDFIEWALHKQLES